MVWHLTFLATNLLHARSAASSLRPTKFASKPLLPVTTLRRDPFNVDVSANAVLSNIFSAAKRVVKRPTFIAQFRPPEAEIRVTTSGVSVLGLRVTATIFFSALLNSLPVFAIPKDVLRYASVKASATPSLRSNVASLVNASFPILVLVAL